MRLRHIHKAGHKEQDCASSARQGRGFDTPMELLRTVLFRPHKLSRCAGDGAGYVAAKDLMPPALTHLPG